MNNPIKIWRELKSIYLKYIDSGLPLSDDRLADERRKLFNEPGAICQPPIIELVSNYETKDDLTLSQICDKLDINPEFADFVRLGLFEDGKDGKERKLYQHQKDAIEYALMKERMHVIATTGTGSGKTECFLLPIIADLIEESKNWDKNRTRAVRALILYPLNALAEDQMIRLRKTVNSSNLKQTGTRDWLDQNRKGHRFYFGRYTGKTPFSGKKDSKKLNDEKYDLKRNWEAAKNSGNKDFLYHIPCMDEGSSEMWDRWSMQETPPDILITNYSMLNIMLMRKQEDAIFEQTKQWLLEDKRNIFHLVVDEMHSYRGTAGTEVAYLLRLLLKRLGLEPDSEQVQFLASSASMQDNDRTRIYLATFFGVRADLSSKKFKLLTNPKSTTVPKPNVSISANLFSNNIHLFVNDGAVETMEFLESLSCSSFTSLCANYKLKDWLKFAMQNEDSSSSAKNIYELANKIFARQDEEAINALEGVLVAIGKAKTITYAALQPMRAHYFFRNIDGLWACTNPDCSEVEKDFNWEDRKIGKLYRSPGKAYCNCGGKILELLICRSCGEPYFWGYELKELGKRFVVCDQPSFQEPLKYITIWPNPEQEGDPLKRENWLNNDYKWETGELSLIPNRLAEYSMFCTPDNYPVKYPNLCPKCGIEYTIEDARSILPISKHSTGVQKVNQVMADALMRSMRQEKDGNPKLVLFSDSRQSAAKLSAGIELDHYRDVLRKTVIESLESQDININILLKYREFGYSGLTDKEKDIFRSLSSSDRFLRIKNLIRDEKEEGIINKEVDDFLDAKSLIELRLIEDKVWPKLAFKGINPAGPKPSKYSYFNSDWKNLYRWDEEKVETNDLPGHLEKFHQNIIKECNTEQLITIFAHKKRSFESLKIGYITADIKDVEDKFSQFIDVVIRLLGEEWKIANYDTKYHRTSFPNSVWGYAKKVFGDINRDGKRPKMDRVKQLMSERKIINFLKIELSGVGLYFKKVEAGDDIWICSKCSSIHLHPSCGVCYNCLTPLGASRKIEESDLTNSNDYYQYLATFPETFRLHCEELTGQTSKEDSTKRQRHFQGFFQEDEVRQVDEIDLLSVTTTMEAGVDIGSLSAVMMGNVPPQRFNYQQRVGRAGRRGHSFSIALTIAKGNSHDQTHYHQTERMVSSVPKDPYLEIHSSEIAERMIIKEVLRESFKEINSDKGITDNVHGDFGNGFYWKDNRKIVADWIENNHNEIWAIINCLSKETELNKSRDTLFSVITSELITMVNEVVNDEKKYPQEELSEKLANAGLLPMFGFPTRVRSLYEKEPEKLPATEVVDRPIDLAISTFAPGCEIVKDKKVLKSVGFVTYKTIKGPKPIEFEGINQLSQDLLVCNDCGNTSISGELKCECSKGGNAKSYKVCSPLGFCVDYEGTPKDFNGIFEWNPVTTSVSIDSSSELDYSPPKPIKNLKISTNTAPRTGLVHLINTNGGALFKIGRYNNTKRYCVKNAFEPDRQKAIRISFEKDMALIASKTTGILTASINATNASINISPLKDNPNNLAVQSAFISWGFLIRMSVCDLLDIESNEVIVDFRINNGKGEIYIVESLENGAGYCNYLSGRIHDNVPEDALIKPLLEGGTIYKDFLLKEKHLAECNSSCYDCIRDYFNQKYHSILSWRLGLDIARLANDLNCIVDFNTEYWVDYIENTASQLTKRWKGEMIGFENGTYIIKGVDSSYLITHPFWSKQFVDELKKKLDFEVADITISEVLRKIRF
ncbi:MAG: hypothetical protein C0397_17315 [Odoribacter sp.]|nr:hypothetical protein [Odoribacter sp.]